MGGCASRPKALDDQAPEDKPIDTTAPSDVTSAPAEATAGEAAAESEEITPEHEHEEPGETAAPVEGEPKKDGPSTGDDPGTHQEQEQQR